MQDLFELHKEVLASVDNGTITVEEAEVLYDEMFEEQVNSLILDVYEAYDEGVITVGECNEYLTTIAEAAKGDKLDKKEEKKIDKELDNVPENERKVIEDSIKKASKEAKVKKAAAIAGGAAATALALKAIDNGIKAKKHKGTMKKVRSEKDVKESATVYETTAHDSREKLKEIRKAYNDAIDKCNKNIRDDKYDDALKCIDDARKQCKLMHDEVAGLDSNVGGVIVSGLCEGLISSLKATCVGLGVGMATRNSDIGSGASIGIGIVDTVKVLYGIIKSAERNGTISVSDFNATKAKVIASIDTMDKVLDKKEKYVKDLKEKAEKKEEETKESVDDILDLDAELALFEKEMTDDEKEHLAGLAVGGTLAAAITIPFAISFISLAKGFKKVKEGNKYFNEIQAVDSKISSINAKYLADYNKLSREWEDIHEYSSLFKKFYIPTKNKEKMKDLKEKFRKLEDDYKKEVAPFVAKRRELEKKYTDNLTK